VALLVLALFVYKDTLPVECQTTATFRTLPQTHIFRRPEAPSHTRNVWCHVCDLSSLPGRADLDGKGHAGPQRQGLRGDGRERWGRLRDCQGRSYHLFSSFCVGSSSDTHQALLLKNAKVYLAARSKDKAEVAIARLKVETGREALFLGLDLGDLASVRASVSAFLSQEKCLHILFENASVPQTRPYSVAQPIADRATHVQRRHVASARAFD
jgi:hypothetical protein